MSDSSVSNKPALVRPANMNLSTQDEEKMVQFVMDEIARIKKDRGHEGPGLYQRGSWMWKRAVATRRYGNDFSDRLSDPTCRVWQTKNLSWNYAKVFVNQNTARAGADFDGPFFAIVPEGVEDGDPALKPAERYLHQRADDQNLGEKIENHAIRGTLIRGESVYCAIPNMVTKLVRRDVRLVVIDGQPLKDSHGQPVTELDVWMQNPLNENEEFLVRDPNVTHTPAGEPLPLSSTPTSMLVPENVPAGCDLSFPFWADFFADIYARTLEESDVKGHCFEMKLDDLLNTLPPHLRQGKAFDLYREAAKQGDGSQGLSSEASQPIWRKGEQQEQTQSTEPRSLGKNLYAYVWFRYDADGDNIREDLMMLVDLGRSWPILYGRAEQFLGKRRTHPYGLERIRGEEGRWWGNGHYDEHNDLCEAVDADLNRLEIEKAKSGNLIFENPNATEEGKAGIPLNFRGPSTFTLTGNNTNTDAVKVTTVTAQTAEISETMEANMQALTARGGMLTPGETEASNLDAAQTLGGLQILDRTKSLANDALEREMNRGLARMLQTWCELEVQNPDLAAIEEMLDGATVEVPQMNPDGTLAVDQQTGQPIMNQVKESTLVIEWFKKLKGRRAGNVLKLVRTKSRSLQIIANQQNIKVLCAEYAKLPAPLRLALKDTFVGMLQALDHPDPASQLAKIDEAMQAIEEAQTAAAMEAGIPPAEAAASAAAPVEAEQPEPVI